MWFRQGSQDEAGALRHVEDEIAAGDHGGRIEIHSVLGVAWRLSACAGSRHCFGIFIATGDRRIGGGVEGRCGGGRGSIKTNRIGEYGGDGIGGCGRWAGAGLGGVDGLGARCEAVGPTDFQLFAGALGLAPGGGAAAVDFLEDVGAFGILDEDGAERVGAVFGREGGVSDVDDLGLDAGVAALEPEGADEVVEEHGFIGSFGLVGLLELAGEVGEGVGVFAGEDFGLSEEAELERVARGGGFAFGGAGSGGVLRVGDGSVDLRGGSHIRSFLERKKGGPAAGLALSR